MNFIETLCETMVVVYYLKLVDKEYMSPVNRLPSGNMKKKVRCDQNETFYWLFAKHCLVMN